MMQFRKFRIQKYYLTLAFFILLMLAACIQTPQDRRVADEAEPTPIPTAVAVSKPTYTVERGRVVSQRVLNGRIVPVFDTTLSFSLNGVVAEVFVDRNGVVKAGDPIARLDIAPLEEERILAQAAFDIAEARLVNSEAQIGIERSRAELAVALAQLDLDYARSRSGANPTGQAAYEISRLEILLSLAQLNLDELSDAIDPTLRTDVESAALRLSEAKKALEQAVLVAPVDGKLLSLNLSPGRAVDAFESIGTIADISSLEISAQTSTTNMEDLEEGMPVSVSFSSRPGESFSGEIRRLPYPYGSGERNDEDTSVRISFLEADVELIFEVGDRVSVQITIAEKDDVLWLPPAAVREFNGREFVIVQDESGNQRRVDILIGLQGRDKYEILDGLQEGELIIGQ